MVSFCAVGDILLDRGCRTMINRRGTGYPFECVNSFIRMHDIRFANLECPISSRGRPIAKGITFRADSAFVEVITQPGFTILSLANNHALDYGPDALLDTQRILRRNGFAIIGAGRDGADAARPVILERSGLKIAFLAYVTIPQAGLPYRADFPCTAFPDTAALGRELARLRSAMDCIVVSFHWGTEYVSRPSEEQIALAHFAVDHGADLILGHHPHVLQSIEKYRGKFIVYSLGNFVFDQHEPLQRESMIFGCFFTHNGVETPYILPVELPYRTFRPVIPGCGEGMWIAGRIEAISRGFGVSFRDGDRLLFLE